MELPLTRFIWRTRFRFAGHQFLSIPRMTGLAEPLALLEACLPEDPGGKYRLARGRFALGQGRFVPFVAAVFQDPTNQDDPSRQIYHRYICLAEPSTDSTSKFGDVGTAWYLAVHEQLRVAYTSEFDVPREADQKSVRERVTSRLGGLNARIQIPEGENTDAWDELGTVQLSEATVPKAHAPPMTPSPREGPRSRPLGFVLALLVGALILWAVTDR